jgi:RNA polymerase subunit RPABC4/transcription elongation factor Spt4
MTDERTCPRCGGTVEDSDTVCPHCGESLVGG